MVDFTPRLARAGLAAVLAVVFATAASAQSRDQRIAERIKPVGEVCLLGEPCAGSTASATVADSPQTSVAEGQAFNAEQTYQQSCAVCHNSGMAGAPKLGDDELWASRLEEKGMATLVQNAITGINAMPPRGMCTTCSDEDMETLVRYLAGQED